MRNYLVVDDNLSMAENLAEILVDSGATASCTSSAAEALPKLMQFRFDALVTDMRMPGMSGAELAREIHRSDPGLPVAIITAYSGERELADARRVALLGVLPKPVPIPRLLSLLAGAKRAAVVAVLEENAALRESLHEVLGSHGFSVVSAATLQELDDVIRAGPMAALVDLGLVGGPEGAGLRRLMAELPELPLLVMTYGPTALPDHPHRGVIAKPFATSALLASLDDICRVPSSPQAATGAV